MLAEMMTGESFVRVKMIGEDLRTYLEILAFDLLSQSQIISCHKWEEHSSSPAVSGPCLSAAGL